MIQVINKNNKLTLDEYDEEDDEEIDSGIKIECGNKKSLLQTIASKLIN